MCISHGFQLSYALSVVLALNAGPGVLRLEKKKKGMYFYINLWNLLQFEHG